MLYHSARCSATARVSYNSLLSPQEIARAKSTKTRPLATTARCVSTQILLLECCVVCSASVRRARIAEWDRQNREREEQEANQATRKRIAYMKVCGFTTEFIAV